MTGTHRRSVGEYIREQRRKNDLSVRQLAHRAGVSNPYLSQIERGLRHPSADILQQIASGLRISAETLYVRAGILDQEGSSPQGDVVAAVQADTRLTGRQKDVLVGIYEAYCLENAQPTDSPVQGDPAEEVADAGDRGAALV